MLSLTELKRDKGRKAYDCFPSALSCMVDLPYEEMPQLKFVNVRMITNPTPRSRWGVWFRKNSIRVRAVATVPKHRLYIGIYRAVGMRRRVQHAVVCYNGEIVHDTARYPGKLSKEPLFMLVVEEYDY